MHRLAGPGCRGPGDADARIHKSSASPRWVGSRSLAQIRKRLTNRREAEFKPGLEQAPGDYAPTLDQQLGLGSQDKGAHLEHPIACRQTERDTTNLSQGAHHVAIGN